MTAPDPRLEEIESRLSKATPGPWEARQDFIDGGVPDNSMTLNGGGRGDYIGTIALHYDVRAANAEFIAHAPTDVAYLLAELRKAQDALARVSVVAGSLEARASMNERNIAAGLYDEAMELAADAASSLAREAAAQLRAAVADATGGERG